MKDTPEKNELFEIKNLERSVLSSFLYYYKDVINMVNIEELPPSIFVTESARTIYQTLLESDLKNNQFDLITITNQLKKNCKTPAKLKECLTCLDQLSKDVQYYNIETHINYLNQYSIKLHLNNFAKEIIDYRLNHESFNDYISNWENKFLKITTQDKTVNYLSSEEAIEQYDSNIKNNKNLENNLKTNFLPLDKKIKGLMGGQFVVIASRPGIGKTTFALNLVNLNIPHILKKEDKSSNAIGVFSLEMVSDNLIEKLIAINSKIELKKIQQHNEGHKMANFEIDLVNRSKETIKGANILFCDEANITLGKIVATIKLWCREYKMKVVIIDYLQLINLPHEYDSNNSNQYQKIGQISRRLKVLSLELNICILALAQLNRKSEDRKTSDKSPILSDLRESGSIEQDADIVMFLYSDSISNKFEGEAAASYYETEIKLKIGKNRHGPIGQIGFIFHKNIGSFVIDNNPEGNY